MIGVDWVTLRRQCSASVRKHRSRESMTEMGQQINQLMEQLRSQQRKVDGIMAAMGDMQQKQVRSGLRQDLCITIFRYAVFVVRLLH